MACSYGLRNARAVGARVVNRCITTCLLLFALFASQTAAAAITWTNVFATPGSGTVDGTGYLQVSLYGYVQAGKLDAITRVTAYNDNVAVAYTDYVPDEDENGVINQLRSFDFKIRVAPGTHTLKLVATTYVSATGTSSLYTITANAPAALVNGATFVSPMTVPTSMVAGQTYNVAVTMKNSGTKPWTTGGSNPYRLGFVSSGVEWLWGVTRVEVGSTIAPGASKTFNFTVTAPATAGSYAFKWQMLEEGQAWFGDAPSTTVTVTVPQPTALFNAPDDGKIFTASGSSATVSFTGTVGAGTGATVSSAQFIHAGTAFGSGSPTVTGSKAIPLGNNQVVQLKVVDSRNQTTTVSRTIHVRPSAPSAIITSPENNATFNATTATYNLPVTATATPASGASISQMRIYVDNVLKTPSSGASLSYTATLSPGKHSIEVDAVDNYGTVSSTRAGISVTVVAPAPTVIMTSPPNYSYYVAVGGKAAVPFQGTATAVGGIAIKQIEAMDGASTVDTATGVTSYNKSVSLSSGLHTVSLKATNTSGISGLSNNASIYIVDQVSGDSAATAGVTAPAVMRAGQPYTVTVSMLNNGTTTWTDAANYRLGSQNPQDNRTWGGRAFLSSSVAPGQVGNFEFQVTAPSKPGVYNFQWQMLQEYVKWFGAMTANSQITVQEGPGPVSTLSATPTNVRVSGTQTQTVTFTGQGSRSGGIVSKVELFQNSGRGYGKTAVASATGSAATLNLSKSLALGAGVHSFRLRTTDSAGVATDSAEVFVNITNSALLGAITGVRSNGAGAPELFGWACQAGNASALTYKVLLDAPSLEAGGVPLTEGTANVATESDNAGVTAQCGSGGHHFVVDLSSYVATYAGRALYVFAQNAAASATVSLPCADNNCTMPGTLRVGLTSPTANAIFGASQPAFLKMKLSNYSGSVDEVGFMVNGSWIAAQPDGAAGEYSVQKTGLAASATPYTVYARVRQGNTTVRSVEVPFYVSSSTITLNSPSANTTLTYGQAQSLSATVSGATATAVRFYANGSQVAVGSNSNGVWSGSWTPAVSGSVALDARAYDSSGAEVLKSAAVQVTVTQPSAGTSNPVNITPPHLGNEDAGTLPGSLSVGGDGAARYGIDLVVPPGSAGMQPALSLGYTSNGSNGLVGLGWSLGGLSTIHRCPKTVAQDGVAGRISFDTADRLCLDGQRLLRADAGSNAQDGDYWAAGAQYRTEIESFSRVTRQSNGGFMVEDKSGRIRYFGTDANSAIAAQGRTDGQALVWALSRVEDRSGNYMTLRYSTDTSTGEYKPESIRYGGNTNANTSPDLAVRFSYASRTDAQVQYMGGSHNDLRSLLSHVKTYINTASDGSGGRLVSDYEINYTNSANSGRSLVNWIQLTAYNEAGTGQTLPRTDFTYGSGGTPKLVQKQRFELNVIADGENQAIVTFTGDFLGTGLTSVVVPWMDCLGQVVGNVVPCNTRKMNGKLSGRSSAGDWFTTVDLTQVSGPKFTDVVTGDLNGDGRDDLVLVERQGSSRAWAYCLAQASAQSAPAFDQCQPGGALPPFRNVSPNGDIPAMVGLDNNGKSQLLYFDEANQAHVCGYNGAISCRTLVTTMPSGVLSTGFMPIQLSKQGQSDFYAINDGFTATNVAVCRLVKDNLVCESLAQGGTSTAGSGAGDLNGDGLTDFFFGTSASGYKLCLSRETGVDCAPMVSKGLALPSLGSVGVGYYFAGIGDLLGDGVSRYLGYDPQSAQPYVVCRLVDSKEVCQAIDTSAIPAETVSLIGANETYSLPYVIDESGVPAALNCTSVTHAVSSQNLQSCWVTSLAMSAGEDLLKSVRNGVGHVAEVDYAMANDGVVYSQFATVNNVKRLPVYPQMTTSPGVLVKQLRQANGQGGAIATNYGYAGAMRDGGGRGSLGFTTVSETNVATGIRTENDYAQIFPKVGMGLSGRQSSGSCQMMSSSSTLEFKTFTLANGASSYFPYEAEETVQKADLNCSALGTVKTVSQYNDGWGNLNVQTVTTTGGGRSFVQESKTDYMVAPGLVHLSGLPTSSKVTRTDGGSVTRTVARTYNATTGLQETETVEPDDLTLKVLTTFDRSRNQFGLVNKVTQTWANPACGEAGWPESGCVAKPVVDVSDTTYDTKGRFPLTVVNAANLAITQEFDAATGARTRLTDANGLITKWTLNNFGRARIELRPDGNETRSEIKRCVGDCPFHATTAQITEQFRGTARIAVPQVVYRDSAGHVERSKSWSFDGTPVVADQRYDGLGRMVEADQPRYESTSVSYLANRQGYDDLNRVTSTTTWDESGTQYLSTTDYRGLELEQTNAKSQKRTETRDVLGQLRSVLDSNTPQRGTTSFTYLPFGELRTTTDPNGNVITVDYDVLGRKTGLRDPDLGYIEYKLDPLGRTYAQRSAVDREKGSSTWTSYDKLGRMTARYERDLESHWVYDTAANGKGQLAEAYTGQPGNKDYRRVHEYDSMGRPGAVTQRLPDCTSALPLCYKAWPTYDAWGRVDAQNYQRGTDAVKKFDLRFNNYGYLWRVDRGALALWQVSQQDAANRVKMAILGNGLIQSRTFSDYSGRLKNAELLTAANVARLQESYSYDQLGNVKTRGQYWDAGGFQEEFSYDDLNRLKTSQVLGKALQSFSYDAAGNLKSKTDIGNYEYYSNGSGPTLPHAVKTISGIAGTFGYDSNGNLLSGAGRVVSWTSFDMPETITKGTSSARFKYGPEHQRLSQQRGDGLVIYAGGQEVEPVAGGGVRVKTYWPNGLGVEIEQAGATQLHWTHLDRLGSPVAMTGEDGAIRTDGKLEYDAWGKRRSVADNASTDDGIDGKIDNRGFTGHEMLDQLDLVHMNGRVYDPLVAKFLSGDPLITDPMNGQRYNRYSYVLNNPTNLIDPTGFQEEKPIPSQTVPGEKNFLDDWKSACKGQVECTNILNHLSAGINKVSNRVCSGSLDYLCSTKVKSTLYNSANRRFASANNTIGLQGNDKLMNRLIAEGGHHIPGPGEYGYIPGAESALPRETAETAVAALTVVDGGVGLYKLGSAAVGKFTLWAAKEYGFVTTRGLEEVSLHLAKFRDSPENTVMLNRLQSGERTQIDKNFYAHELKESSLMRNGMEYEAAHRATLQWQGIPYQRGFEAQLYHPEAMKAAGLETWSVEALQAARLIK